jgi:hypothetical protein
LIIRLILDYRNCVIIMHFGAPNPYNDTGVRYYNLLWYNCKHIYVIYLKEEFGDIRVNSCAPEVWAALSTLVTPVVLL